ncbi:pyrophosphate-energized vacuolar membrane proton pump-like [Hordeum vulgare subsp. vulgare]|uniref:pyrophosphate-energized vacuolar membrane proton pump-like n=1 Tax=Hordeum vulgare subsp. vulgare TaxID=112509 RepID=UPI001D1A3CDD|nr:pyrophosphate-energized vacuolar membrane proton pump-like [Hordeum vulgare subsp. vulgare]
MAILGELGTEILIPVCGVIGIVFAVAQWFIVSKVKVTPSTAFAAAGAKNGYGDYLIEEEEGLNDHNVVIKCAEIQTAIREGSGGVAATGSYGSPFGLLTWGQAWQQFMHSATCHGIGITTLKG